jgi:hypothetical protein
LALAMAEAAAVAAALPGWMAAFTRAPMVPELGESDAAVDSVPGREPPTEAC